MCSSASQLHTPWHTSPFPKELHQKPWLNVFLFAWKINNFSLRCNPTWNWNHSTHYTIRRQMPRVPGLQTWGFTKICSTRCPQKMFSFSSKQGNLLKWLNFTHSALSIQINFYSRLKSHALFLTCHHKLKHLLQWLEALFLREDSQGFKPTCGWIFLLVSTLAFIVKETKQKLFSSSQRTAHLAFGALPLTSGQLSSWNPAWWNVLCLGNFWKRPRNKFVPMDECLMKAGMRSRWRRIL